MLLPLLLMFLLCLLLLLLLPLLLLLLLCHLLSKPAMGEAVQRALLSIATSQLGEKKAEALIQRMHDCKKRREGGVAGGGYLSPLVLLLLMRMFVRLLLLLAVTASPFLLLWLPACSSAVHRRALGLRNRQGEDRGPPGGPLVHEKRPFVETRPAGHGLQQKGLDAAINAGFLSCTERAKHPAM